MPDTEVIFNHRDPSPKKWMEAGGGRGWLFEIGQVAGRFGWAKEPSNSRSNPVMTDTNPALTSLMEWQPQMLDGVLFDERIKVANIPTGAGHTAPGKGGRRKL